MKNSTKSLRKTAQVIRPEWIGWKWYFFSLPFQTSLNPNSESHIRERSPLGLVTLRAGIRFLSRFRNFEIAVSDCSSSFESQFVQRLAKLLLLLLYFQPFFRVQLYKFRSGPLTSSNNVLEATVRKHANVDVLQHRDFQSMNRLCTSGIVNDNMYV